MKFKLIYDLNGIDDVFGYAKGTGELKKLIENAIDNGIIEFRIEKWS